MKYNFKDLTGQKFRHLLVLERGPNKKGSTTWKCLCDCGTIKIIHANAIKAEKTTSCGCQKTKKGNLNHGWRGHGDISLTHFSSIKNSAIGNRTRKGRNSIIREFKITIEQIWDLFLKQNKKCALSGIELQFGSLKTKIETTASLDRIDSSKGYTIDNVQWIHKHINFMKSVYDEDYFIEMCKRVANNC